MTLAQAIAAIMTFTIIGVAFGCLAGGFGTKERRK
jgi:ABC-type dipeptide/oligopeptide/nickel transport system permease subunit